MKRQNMVIGGILLFAVALLSFSASGSENLTGTWLGKMHIPNFGSYEMTLKLEKTESGYKGIVNDKMGYIEKDTEVQELEFNGRKLVCWFKMTDGAVCDLRLTEEDGIMTGEAEREGGVVSCVFIRDMEK